jgi:hypothetical protein
MKLTHIIILFLGLFLSALTGFTLILNEPSGAGKFDATDKNFKLVWAPEMKFAMMKIGIGNKT